MSSGLLINLAALAFSFLAIVTSTVTVLRQTKIIQQGNLLPIVIDMFKEFRTTDFKRHYAYITTELAQQHQAEKTGYMGLPEDAKSHIDPVTSFYDTVGILVANGVVKELTVASYMGRSIIRSWRSLEPFIRIGREEREDENWHLFFENLAFLTMQNPPSRISERLNLNRMPVASSLRSDASSITELDDA